MATNGVTLIQCTATKRDHPALAWDLYHPSAYFRKQRRWARARKRATGDPWFILSGKHGLVHPSRPLEPYNARGLSEQQARDAAAELADMGVGVVHIHAGRDYTGPLIPELEGRGIDVVEHCAGENIGVRQKHLAEKADRLDHATL